MVLAKNGNGFTALRKLAAISLALSLQLSGFSVQVFAADAVKAAAPATQIQLDRLAALADGSPLKKEEIPSITAILVKASNNKLAPKYFFQKPAYGKTRLSQQGRELILNLLEVYSTGQRIPDDKETSLTSDTLLKLRAGQGSLTAENLDKIFDNSAENPGSPETAAAPQNGPAGKVVISAEAKAMGSNLRTALPVAILTPYAGQATGVTTWIHEQSHIEVSKALQNPEKIGIQIDAFENIKNFFSKPSWENLKRVLIRHDVDQNGFGGYMWTSNNRPTKLGTMLGEKRSDFAVVTAGSIGQDAPALAGYAAGFAMRKKAPGPGYTLMLTSAIHHVTTALYPWQAAVLPGRGGDWVRVANYTGIHPIITAVAFTAILPVEALVLSRLESMMEKSKENRLALYNLANKGAMDDAGLRSIFDAYARKNELSMPKGTNISDLLKMPPEQLVPGAKGPMVKEIRDFQAYVIKQNQALIEEERARLPKLEKSALCRTTEYFKERYKIDKAGAGLEVGTMATSLAVGLAGIASVADWAGREAAGSLLKTLAPALGLFTIAASGNSIRNILKDTALNKTQKLIKLAQHAGGILSSISLLNPATAPIMLPAGLAVTLTAMATEWLYNRHTAKQS